MPNHTALYLLTDRVLDGRLDEMLVHWAEAGASRRVAARLLAGQLGGIQINPTTVQRWTAEALREGDEGNGDREAA